MNKVFIEKNIFELSKVYRNTEEFLINLYYCIFSTYPRKFYLQQYNADEGVVVEEYASNFKDDNANTTTLRFDKKKFCQSIEENPDIFSFLYNGDYIAVKCVIGNHFILCLPLPTGGSFRYCSVLSESPIYIQELKSYLVLDEKQDTSVEYYFLVHSKTGFDLITLSLDKEKITTSLEENYNSDLPIEEINHFIENELGIFIFNGLPGTGKSSLLKYLIANTKSKFIWMDSDLLVNLNSDTFLSFIIDNARDAVIILEDCEKLLMDRKLSFNPNLGTLLNISDGILGDSLKLKFICTFNSDLRNIDSAILRKGRLKGKYEFKKLNTDKVNNLCKKLNIPEINCPSTLAEIYNQAPNSFGENKQTKIGF